MKYGSAAVVGLCLLGCVSCQAPGQGKATVHDLSLEVAALQTLYQFRFTPEQMRRLQKMARETAGDAGARPVAKVSDQFRRTLAELRDALIAADDADRIFELSTKVEELREAESPELDDAVDLTEAAIRRAPELLRQLSARQVASFLTTYGDEAPDPLEDLLDALGKVRGLDAKQWKQLRESIADNVGRLVVGLDAEKASRVGDRAVQLLIQARALPEADFQAQKADLEKEARLIVGDVGPLDVLRHLAEHALAELLSNPRLEQALAARLK